jgi:hypothetical protein
MKVCLICGKEIAFSSRARKYCSDECRKRVKYEKDRAWLKAHPGKTVEYSRKWREENAERVRQNSHDAYRKKCLEKIKEGD